MTDLNESAAFGKSEYYMEPYKIGNITKPILQDTFDSSDWMFSKDEWDIESFLQSWMNSNFTANSTAKDWSAFQAIVWHFNLYFTPVIICIGLIGNILSFLVLTFTHVHRLSASVYLTSLAISDVLFLVALTIAWLDGQLGITVFVTDGCCQFVVFLTHLSGFLAVWNVLGFTADRYIVAYHPLKKDVLCTRQKAVMIVASLTAVAVLFYSNIFWTYDVIRFGNHMACSPLPKYHDVNNILMSIDTLFACVIPSVVIVILNIRVMIKLHEYQSKYTQSQIDVMRQLGSSKKTLLHTSISNMGNVHIKFTSGKNQDISNEVIHPVEQDTDDINPEMNGYQAIVKSRSQFRTARMLLVLSSVFVLLNLPYHIFRIHSFLGHLIGIGPQAPKNNMAWHELFQLLYFLNFAINFFIYSACGHQFRIGLKRLTKRLKRKVYRCKKKVTKRGCYRSIQRPNGNEMMLNDM